MATQTGTSTADRVVKVFNSVGLGSCYLSVVTSKSPWPVSWQDDAPTDVLPLQCPHKVEAGNPYLEG